MSGLTPTPTPSLNFSQEHSGGGRAVDTNTQSRRVFSRGASPSKPNPIPSSNSRTCLTKSFRQKPVLVRGHKSRSGRSHTFPSSPTEAVAVASKSPPQPQRTCSNVASSGKSSLPSSTLLSAPMALSICLSILDALDISYSQSTQSQYYFFSKYLFTSEPPLPD